MQTTTDIYSLENLAGGAAAIVRKGGARVYKAGGLWIYDNEIDRFEGAFEDGDILAVQDFDGFFLGWGFVNRASRICIRMLSRRQEHIITPAFLTARVRAAWEYRKKVIDTSSCRVIFGEADFLPGLTVDKYEDVLVVESLALGIDRLKPLLLSALVQVLAEDGIIVRGIYERSDAKVREKEGLPRYKGFIGEPFDTQVPIIENGVRYVVDVENGQKTGFFLDQKENRQAIAKLCAGARVLDCFTHTGSFGLNAALAGAAEVTSVDASDLAIAQAQENAGLNGFTAADAREPLQNSPKPGQDSKGKLDVGRLSPGRQDPGAAEGAWLVNAAGTRLQYQCADIFDLLPSLHQRGELYDVVILDPPAFTKSRNSIKAAVRGYREINQRGMRLVRDGGFLATCSCSHFMDPELFRDTIARAARDAHKRLRQIEFRTQAPDHPILWASEESYYLKFYIFQVSEEQ
ncbi:MAG: class I SAM-dependent rRNA methyltransferase [Eubacteriales bacterium]|nr:class I SAM-dependent rRNA methyltransferase [Eubacteriales bacterium]